FPRTKHLTQLLQEVTTPKILIDHHLYPAPVWDYGVSLPEKSSTSEMVYDFINLAGDNKLINKDIAECIYMGVLTDTGSFRFPVTRPETHELVADLMRKGLEHSKIHELIYDSWSVRRMQFLGYVLLEKMEILPQYKAGIITLSRKDLKLFDVNSGDQEGLVNYPLSIGSVRFATLITERADEVKLSFRSKGDFDVSSFAREHFNGGGHFNASGGRSTQSCEESVTFFKKVLSDIDPRYKMNMTKNQLLALGIGAVTLGITSCDNTGGIKKTSDGLMYKIVKDEPGDKHPETEDMVEMHVNIRIGDSVIFNSRMLNNNKPIEF